MNQNNPLVRTENQIASVSGTCNNNKTIISISNIRIQQETKVSGGKNVEYIPLENIDSYGVGTSQQTLLLILGILLLLAYGLGLILIAIWWFTRKTGLFVHSKSGKTSLLIEASSSNRKELFDFLDVIQTAINQNK